MLNGTMMQFFHWYTPADGSLWNELRHKADELAELGIDSVWLPPAYKGTGGGMSNGYDVYDIYDLGEFDQKGSVRTKFGTKGDYVAAVEALFGKGIQVYADIVLNHKGGTDEEAVRVELKKWGEYWAPGELHSLLKYIDAIDGCMSLFDSSLHNNLHEASNKGKDYDLTKIFDDTLVVTKPELAVTVVDNHDTRPLQSLEAPIEAWFKPLAYVEKRRVSLSLLPRSVRRPLRGQGRGRRGS